MIKNEKIFITGGAGFLGKTLIKKLSKDNEITIYSRDEFKHYLLKKYYPNVEFIVGDIRNYDLLQRSSRDHSIGIFAASLKQIEACENNAEEASRIIVDGALNSRRISEENKFKASCFISSDKSRAPTTIYGAMKFVAGASFIIHSSASYPETKLTAVIYGNVLNSTGSIIPLMWSFIKEDKEMLLYGKEMTRFIITIQEAINLVETALTLDEVNVIPIAKSCYIKDMFDIYKEEFGLKYKLSHPRSGEKIHEILAAKEEARRMKLLQDKNAYIMHPQDEYNSVSFKGEEYSSEHSAITKEELYKLLKNNNFFKPN